MAIKLKKNFDLWYRMDNSAVIYPISITPTTQSLFRLTAEMAENIDEDFLEKALNTILPRFPSFRVFLRGGFFRHFFDYNDKLPVVSADNGLLFQKINFSANNYFLFRITYYNNKIFADFFHALCDGTGACEFFRALIFQYLKEFDNTLDAGGVVKTADEKIDPDELEDGFVRYHKKYKLFGGVLNKMVGKGAYQIKGEMFKNTGYGLIQGYIETEKLKEVSKKYDCSITVFLIANAFLSLREACQKSERLEKNLVAAIPIDLRKHFPSKTLKNFTSIIKCSLNAKEVEPSLSEYCKIIKNQLSSGININDLSDKLSLSSFMGLKWFMKILPLFVKSSIIKLGKLFNLRTKQTMIISNIGVLKMPESSDGKINRFCFNVNVSRKAPVNMGIISYNGSVSVSFTRKIKDTNIEKSFFRRLSEEGLKVSLVSNFRENYSN